MEKRTAGGRTKPQCIALIGLPASGKSSVGATLARRLGIPFVDLDEQIVEAEGRPIAEIFKLDGEEVFRKLESSFLDRVTRGGKVVLSTGGGCILAAGNRELLRERCVVIWLDLSPEIAAVRAGAGSRKSAEGSIGSSKAAERAASGQDVPVPVVRPLLANGDILQRMKTLDSTRRPLYRESADIIVKVEDKSPAVIVEELYAALD